MEAVYPLMVYWAKSVWSESSAPTLNLYSVMISFLLVFTYVLYTPSEHIRIIWLVLQANLKLISYEVSHLIQVAYIILLNLLELVNLTGSGIAQGPTSVGGENWIACVHIRSGCQSIVDFGDKWWRGNALNLSRCTIRDESLPNQRNRLPAFCNSFKTSLALHTLSEFLFGKCGFSTVVFRKFGVTTQSPGTKTLMIGMLLPLTMQP